MNYQQAQLLNYLSERVRELTARVEQLEAQILKGQDNNNGN